MNIFQIIWLLVVKNWKTTATGLSIAILWIMKTAIPGITIPDEFAAALTAFLISLGFIFSKDGNKSGLID